MENRQFKAESTSKSTFKAKLRKIGNSFGVIIPRSVITELKEGEQIMLKIITFEEMNEDVITKDTLPRTKELPFNTNWCSKHDSMKGTCGCNDNRND